MRSGLIWIVLLIAALAVGWMLFGTGDPSGSGASEDYVDGTGESGDEAGVPQLKGAGADASGNARPRVPDDIRGRGTIQGVVRRGGNPVAATVELRHVQEIDPRDPFKGGVETQFIARLLTAGMSSKSVIARVTAGDDGRYNFRGLATGLYEIRARAEDGALGFGSAVLPAKGARVEASVDIPEGDQSLRGKVVYADGKPFQGMVTASTGNIFAAMMGGGGRSHPTQTADDGTFTLAGLAPGNYQVSAIIPGILRAMGPPTAVPFAGEFLLTINAAGVEMKGTVIDAESEKPIAGAKIFGGGGDPSSSFAIFTASSGADGTFSMTLPGGGNGGMFVRADGYAVQMVDFENGAVGDVTVALLKLGKLTGRVTAQEGGAPIAGITVFATGQQGRGGMGSMPSTAITDADGHYAIDGVSPGTVKVHALGAGFASVGMSGSAFGGTQTPYTADLEPGAEATLDLEAVASGTASGHVLTITGEPVPGAVVQAVGGGMSERMAAAMLGLGSGYGNVVTDADGAYAIDTLVPGSKYKVVAKAPDHPDAMSDEFVAASGKAEVIDLRMKAPRWIDVTVVSATGGKGLVGATIVAIPQRGNQMVAAQIFGGSGTQTGPDGKVRLGPLPEAAVTLHVTAPGYIKSQDTSVALDATAPITVELKPGLVLAGRVVAPDDVPLQSIRLTVRKQDSSNGWYHDTPPVQADGTWRVDNIEHSGEYRVTARSEWKERIFKGEVRVDSGDEGVTVTLEEDLVEKREMLVVRVTDAEGKPVPSGRVQLWSIGRGKNDISTNRSRLNAGRATFKGVAPGRDLYVEVFELVGSKRGATLEGPVTPVDGEIQISLGRPLTIRGAVVGEDGQPVVGVKATASSVPPQKSYRSGQEHGTAVSGTDGTFEIKGLGDLEYVVTFVAPEDYVNADAQTVRAGASDVRVTLKTGLRATLTFVGYDGKPVIGAHVFARVNRENGERGPTTPMSWSRSQTTTDAKGVVTLKGLPTGATFTLTVSIPDGRKDLQALSRTKWTPADETITLKRAWTITGKVVDQNGKAATNMTVRHRKAGTEKWQGWDRTSPDGSFTVKNLDSGAYELKAQGSGMVVAMPRAPGAEAPVEPGVVKARAGATGVRIKTDLGLSLKVTLRGAQVARGRHANASLRSMTPGAFSQLSGEWSDRKTIEFRGLKPGTSYTLWISGLEDGKYAFQEGVTSDARTLSVDAQDGGVITGTLKFPTDPKFRSANVTAHNMQGISVAANVNMDTGAFRIEGLPREGTWQISGHAWGHEGSTRWRAQATARTGANVTLELKKHEGR